METGLLSLWPLTPPDLNYKIPPGHAALLGLVGRTLSQMGWAGSVGLGLGFRWWPAPGLEADGRAASWEPPQPQPKEQLVFGGRRDGGRRALQGCRDPLGHGQCSRGGKNQKGS